MSKLSILLVVIIFTSCTSLKRGYLAKVKNETNNISDSLNLSKIDSIRAFSVKKTDSLLVEYKLHEKEKALRSSLINNLFEQFAIQLNHDRIYTSILQKNSNKKKKNNLIQYHNALVVLLNSAAYYNSTYEKSKRIRRAFNRGDIGNHIPKNVIQKSKRFLYATKVRKKAIENLQQLKTIDSRIYKLPKTNIFKSAGVTLFRKNDRIINTVYGTFSFIGKTFLGSPSEIKLHKKKEKLMIDALS